MSMKRKAWALLLVALSLLLNLRASFFPQRKLTELSPVRDVPASNMADFVLRPSQHFVFRPDTTPAEQRRSFHMCVDQPESSFPLYVGRSCRFTNLYWHRGSLHYYGDVATDEDITTAIGFMTKKPKNMDTILERMENLRYAPQIHNATDLPHESLVLQMSTQQIATLLLYQPSYSFNFGHFLWDDVLSMFYLLDTFGLVNDDSHRHIPVQYFPKKDPFFRCNPKRQRWKDCANMLQRVYTPLTGLEYPQTNVPDRHPLRLSNLVQAVTNDTDSDVYIRIPETLVGTGRYTHYGCGPDCVLHRRFDRARDWVWKNALHKPLPPVIPQILLSLPVGNSHAHIEWFEEIRPALKARFGSLVKTVSMVDLSVSEQLYFVAESTVYLTNQGGGSASTLFLQRDATAILFYTNDKKMDLDLYRNQGIFATEWFVANQTSASDVVLAVERALQRRGFYNVTESSKTQ